jgi:hypothetical protein
MASSTAALSRTLRVSTPSVANPPSDSGAGAGETRPRLGLSETSPQALAGIRSDPRPSLPCPTATAPAATAAAEPPLDPPALRDGSHGFRVAPCASGSVVPSCPSSEVLVRPSTTRPAARNLRASSLSAGAR